jgi:hypothetical protein
MSKALLMLSSAFYPSNVSGAHRPSQLAKYLPLFGWEPRVVCKASSPADQHGTFDGSLAKRTDSCAVTRVTHIPHRYLHGLERRLWGLIGGGSDDYRYPMVLKYRMRNAARRILNEQRVDVIWATFKPGLCLNIAAALSGKYGIPWVADFRDLPDQSFNSEHTKFVVRQEIETCRTAAAVVATTHELSEKLRARHVNPVYTVFNGFDPEEFGQGRESKPGDGTFSINHFGILYTYRVPKALFAAIDQLANLRRVDLRKIEVNFFGANPRMVAEAVGGHKCAEIVKAPARLPYADMVRAQSNSQVLLLVAPPEQGGAIPAKLFGYLAAQRPILSVPGDNAGADRIIEETKAGASLSDPVAIADWLAAAYNQWDSRGLVPFQGEELEIARYSRKAQAAQLAEILDRIVP